tara:strand:+ start:13846 stop:14556 length:711 start_codon:yes stop_codon:yes gene_type:complete
MKDSLRKLGFANMDGFHNGWYSKYNYMLSLGAFNWNICDMCGPCYALHQGLLRRLIESLNGCEESIEFLSGYWELVKYNNDSDGQIVKSFEDLRDEAMKYGNGFEPTKQEVEAFFKKALPGLKSHRFRYNIDQDYSDALTATKISYDRKFFMFLDRHLSREKIHDELCASSAQGFLREMEDYSGEYGTEDNQPYYSPEEYRLDIPTRSDISLANYRTSGVERFYPEILEELNVKSS